MAAASLANYDGSVGVLVDTNIWIDCIDAESPWHDWAVEQLQRCSEKFQLHINPIIYTELLVPGPNVDALDAFLNVYDTQRSQIPWASCALAASAFGLYRRRGGAKIAPLPDFFIGAHAAVANFSVLTRDAGDYSNYFPRLAIISPGRRASA